MLKLRRILAFVLIFALSLSLAACHPQGEKAMKIGDVEITSAQYLYALCQATGEAQSKVQESTAKDNASDTSSDTSSEKINYKEATVEEKPFYTWVEDRAMDICRDYAASTMKANELSLKIDEEKQNYVNYYAQMYWTQGGHEAIYTANGVGFGTYLDMALYSYKKDEYFLSIYGKEGTQPVDEKEVETKFTENYVLANVLSDNFVDDKGAALGETAIADLKAKFEGLKKRLEKGEAFEDIYYEYTGEKPEEETEKTEEKDHEHSEPKDALASVFGSSETNSASEKYDIVKAMKVGEIKIESDDNEIALIVKKEITDDSYYLDTYYDQALYLIKSEEFNKSFDEYKNNLTVEKYDFAMSRLKANKIDLEG